MLYSSQLRQRRQAGRAALCAFNELQFGMARMFQSILEGELLEIREIQGYGISLAMARS